MSNEFEGGFVVTSALDGWRIDVEAGVHPGVAQWVADVIGIGIDYITADDLGDVVDRAKVIERRRIADRAEWRRLEERVSKALAGLERGW